MPNKKKETYNNPAAANLAVIYARFSPGPRQTEQSIEGQVRDCKAYAEQMGLKIVGIYADHHISGTDFENRAEFNRLLSDAEKGQFRYIIVWKIDRFGRDREEIALNKVRVKKYGVKLLYAKENIPDGPEGIILEGLLESLAEYYVADLRQKVKRGQRESAIKGYALGGGRAFGYDIVDKKYAINEAEAAIVLKVFQMYDAGSTAPQIVSYLTSHGLMRRDGKPFTFSGIYHMIRNEKYIGKYMYDDISIPVPQIVPQELWDSVHAKFHQRAGRAASFKCEEKYLLSLKCRCGLCDDMLVGECGNGNGGRYMYYKCATRKRRGSKCPLRVFKKDFLENVVLEYTMKDVLQDDVIEYIADRVIEIQERNSANYTLESLRRRFSEVEKARSNVLNAIEAGIITDTTKERLIELEAEAGELKAHIAREEIKKPALTREHIIYWLNSFRDGDISDPAFAERLCDTFVASVVCYNEKAVIIYNFSGANNNRLINFSSILNGSDEPLKVKHGGFEPPTT